MTPQSLIEDIYAFVSIDPTTHEESLLGMRVDDHWQPLITNEESALDTMRMIARRLAEQGKQTVRLIHFTGREELPV